jgi:hypothetical protein
MLALIVALILIVFVAAAVVRTFFSLALLALIVGAVAVGFGAFRLARRSNRRSRSRY